MRIDDEYEQLLISPDIEKLYSCNSGYMDLEDCSWYHHNWMLLRHLGMVSNPYWHEEFYLSAIKKYVSLETAKALVMGTADFSMPYLCQTAGIKSITICDLCKTPLNICESISNRDSFRWNLKQADIFEGIDGNYDLIINDAFLTRFSYDKKRIVLSRISEGLNHSGKYITTIRHDWNDHKSVIPNDEEQKDFVLRAKTAALKKGINVNKAEHAAKEYISRMISYPIKDKEMLFELANGLFRIEELSEAIVSGECKTSGYYRVVMTKETSSTSRAV